MRSKRVLALVAAVVLVLGAGAVAAVLTSSRNPGRSPGSGSRTSLSPGEDVPAATVTTVPPGAPDDGSGGEGTRDPGADRNGGGPRWDGDGGDGEGDGGGAAEAPEDAGAQDPADRDGLPDGGGGEGYDRDGLPDGGGGEGYDPDGLPDGGGGEGYDPDGLPDGGGGEGYSGS